MTAPGLVVVGAGLAGVRAVESARRSGFDGPITLLGAEDEAPYDRPPLSKSFLTENADLKHLRTGDSLRDELGVDLRLGVAVDELRLQDQTVVAAGEAVPYTGLVIATGSVARDLPGTAGLQGVHTLRTHDDALALRGVLRPGAAVVVVGAGFIGSEIAVSAQQLGAQVTVLEAAPVPLVRAVGDLMGAALSRLQASMGIDVRCGTAVDSFAGSDAVEGVRLADGQVLPAEAVIVGVGAAPVTSWLESSGLDVEDGVVCDRTLNAGAPGVYAAGDVARWDNPTFDRVMRLEHWTAAAEQGSVAGRNAVLDPVDAQDCATVPYFWSDWGTDRIQFVGVPDADEVLVVGGDPADRDLLALYRSGDRLTGALGVNQRKALLRLRMLIAQRGSWQDALDLGRAALPSSG